MCTAKIEQSDLHIPTVDTIISEPIGVFLFHERMVYSYIKTNEKESFITLFNISLKVTFMQETII